MSYDVEEQIKSIRKINSIYFDCNATTHVLPGAIDAAVEVMAVLYGNPSSSHSVGLQAKDLLEKARKAAAEVIGATPEEIIFTSGATEAIQLAIFSALKLYRDKAENKKLKLLYGATEHKVVPQALNHWASALGLSYEIVKIPVTNKGQINIKILREMLPEAALICTMAVNNETGIIQNLAEIEQTLRKTQSTALWLVDGVQALGKIPLQLKNSRIDYAAFSGHKFHAPKGVGFLYCKKNAPIFPLMVGGGQENGIRSGTENLPAIAAFGFVLERFLKNEPIIFQPHEQLTLYRDKLISELKLIFPGIIFNAPFDSAVPTTLNFSIPGLASSQLIDLFDAGRLYVSGGSACNSVSAKSTHVLEAMGKDSAICESAIRLSYSPCTTWSEIKQCCQILRSCGAALYKSGLLINTYFEGERELESGIIQLRSGASNTWMIVNKNAHSCIIIDPCDGVARHIEQYTQCHNLKVLAILDTHSHADHDSIRRHLQCSLLPQSAYGESFYSSLGWPDNIQSSLTLDNGERVSAIPISKTPDGEWVLGQMHTPGHTEDSTTYLLGIQKFNNLKKNDIYFAFSGDMILSGGLGRTDFISSNSLDLYNSLNRLNLVINPNTLLCPSHDYDYSICTNLSTEMRLNPMLQLALDRESETIFINRKKEVDVALEAIEERFQEVICGVTIMESDSNIEITIPPKRTKQFIERLINNNTLIISVIEQQEFYLTDLWDIEGLKTKPCSVPLSRLPNLINELLHTNKFEQNILFICRTGARSIQAAKALRRLGFINAWGLRDVFLKQNFYQRVC
jgi:cysteine sulfinate desulfinase/cysteine desulfurase-like protein/glyoxylase-like metal-dependent hydrolase (beta-lactamase superfamily II)/rhodanese-related sulfurtransferase